MGSRVKLPIRYLADLKSCRVLLCSNLILKVFVKRPIQIISGWLCSVLILCFDFRTPVSDPPFIYVLEPNRLEKRLDQESQVTQGKTTWLSKEIANKCNTSLVDFAVQFWRNMIFINENRKHKNYKETSLKNAFEISPENYDFLRFPGHFKASFQRVLEPFLRGLQSVSTL